MEEEEKQRVTNMIRRTKLHKDYLDNKKKEEDANVAEESKTKRERENKAGGISDESDNQKYDEVKEDEKEMNEGDENSFSDNEIENDHNEKSDVREVECDEEKENEDDTNGDEMDDEELEEGDDEVYHEEEEEGECVDEEVREYRRLRHQQICEQLQRQQHRALDRSSSQGRTSSTKHPPNRYIKKCKSATFSLDGMLYTIGE
ncbi:myb-like protein X isoform X2 [Aplysia californica]|nr:myb-like protein X isoform X2 [Aplysia californica]XP_035826732.1 myb-like protein X isoform X2 [Aplysia californica]XP_035826733.1 myb-like protein X isoform X2 [Aplysia californica]XP_035826734.1 myb-like protein X isoform X2 [Aplysia californica]XP_035826735.1 myb-like protein X isoform X2 [Aplysia californica]XP_035826736.1 myb-like protein X isoform X2 [Aplysia californica]XP_035826737.1 myb-like protein X isoform X2 [Aplysia californica]XP_035826738.1 myb-like protein X isoform X2 [